MPFFQRSQATSIFYLAEGPVEAPAVLLIHGWTCDLHDWNFQVPLLLELGYRVVTADLRGHGRSSAPEPSPGITQWPGPDADERGIVEYYSQTLAEDLARLLDHLSISNAIVMGRAYHFPILLCYPVSAIADAAYMETR